MCFVWFKNIYAKRLPLLVIMNYYEYLKYLIDTLMIDHLQNPIIQCLFVTRKHSTSFFP